MALTDLDISSVDPALKQLYRRKGVEDMTFRKRPLMAMLPKFEGFGGRNMPLVVQYANPQGVSGKFSDAQGNATAAKLEDFLLTRVSQYSVAAVEGEAAEATTGDSYAFVSAMKVQIDGAIRALANTIETQLFRRGWGILGTVGSAGTTTITLGEEEEARNFEVGMSIYGVADAADGDADGALINSGTAYLITGVNRSTGVITSAGADFTSDGFGAADFLVKEGDAYADNSNTKVCISGLDAWVPDSSGGAPGALFGVTRSADSRLYGNTHDGSAQTIEEALIDAQSVAAAEGGSPDCALLNHVQYRNMIKELGSKVNYNLEKSSSGGKGKGAQVGFRSVVVEGDEGPISVIAANKCQAEIGWVLQKDTWILATLGRPTKFLNLDGNKILRVTDDDQYEVRCGFRGNLGCYAPAYNTHVKLPSV